GALIFTFSLKGLHFLIVAVEWGLSFNRPTIQYAQTFHTSHQDFRWPRHCCSAIPWRTMCLIHRQALVSEMPHRSAYSLLQSSMAALTFVATSWRACSKVAFATLSRNCPDFTGGSRSNPTVHQRPQAHA